MFKYLIEGVDCTVENKRNPPPVAIFFIFGEKWGRNYWVLRWENLVSILDLFSCSYKLNRILTQTLCLEEIPNLA